MMRIVFFILFFFLLIGDVYAGEPKDPELNEIIDWIPEEVPRTVSFYIDTNKDNIADIIVTYSLIEGYACKENCVYDIIDNGDHWLLPSEKYIYYVVKRWTYWKYVNDKDWRSVDKTSASVYKYKYHVDWYEKRFLKMYPKKRLDRP